jgi:hypothetical protein
MKHTHACGLGDGEGTGCGHTWSHDDSCATLPDKEFKEAHTCPNCGAGPWTFKVESSRGAITSALLKLLGDMDA